jgi:hypothetical protein
MSSGITACPDGPWTTQQIRNLLMDVDRAADFSFLIRDRAGQLTSSFDAALGSTGIMKIPPRSPRANAASSWRTGLGQQRPSALS